MKKRNVLTIVIVLMALTAWTQPSITLLTFESYTFPDQFDTEYGHGKIQDGFQWGGGLEFGLAETAAVELIYQNLKTDAYYNGYYTPIDPQKSGNIGINYVMLGGTKYAPLNDKISGFGTVDMGVAWSNPDTNLAVESATKFAIGARLGVRIKASEKVSLRIHGQVFSPVQWAGGGFFVGTGGSGAGVSTGSTIWQFNLGGSLNYRIR
jgi:opacity protein-like surface antigen